MKVDVLTETVIQRPRHDVASYAMDPGHAPAWYENIRSVQWQTVPPLEVGSRLVFVARFLGRDLVYTYEIAELVADERLVMRTSAGPFPMETTYEFESLGPHATRVRLRNRGTPAGFAVLFAPFMALAIRRANRKDLLHLKGILERPR